jgi:uncharacterized iron-regulated membrane protein
MNGRFLSFGSGNPLAQALSLLVFAMVLIGAVIMGAVVLAAIVGLAIVGFAVLKLRSWWSRRGSSGHGPGGPAKEIRYIEAEYEVLDTDAEAERRRSGERR